MHLCYWGVGISWSSHMVLHIPESGRIQDESIYSEFNRNELDKKYPGYMDDSVLEHSNYIKVI